MSFVRSAPSSHDVLDAPDLGVPAASSGPAPGGWPPPVPAAAPAATRVLVVDDQPLIRSGLRSVIDAAPGLTVVGEACDGAEAVSAARETAADVVLMDLNMPKVNGVEATLQVLRFGRPPKVLVLTTLHADDIVVEALEAGASGFLDKDVRGEELVAAVHTVTAGGTCMSRGVMSRLVERAGRRKPAAEPGQAQRIGSLSSSERAVLGLIGSGLTNQQIATQLHLSVASVKTYVSRMLTTLRLENRTQAAILAYEAGLLGEAATAA
ncbi:response regulator transcription factor [Streptomyces sp. NPDC001941]|uniref:response regulator transcription factor n=1 Tax=Streptomyces sp. NPDC001941 TaxID=3154659 RepID=UPI003334766F